MRLLVRKTELAISKEPGHERVNEQSSLEESFTIRVRGEGDKNAEIYVSATDRKVKRLRLHLPGDAYGSSRQELDLLRLPKGVTLESIAAAIRVELADYIWSD